MTDIRAAEQPVHTVQYGDRPLRFVWHTRDVNGGNASIARKARIHVHPNGLVEVVTPRDVSLKDAKDALLKRARWVNRHLLEIEKRRSDALKRRYVSGETLFYLGRRYVLKVIKESASRAVKMRRGQIRVMTPDASPEIVKRMLEQWYRDHARDVFARRLRQMVDRLPWIDIVPSCSIRNMKKQWGSCSPSGAILLNPHLVKAPAQCVDYVILHELCHMKEHNHSRHFYTVLSSVMSDWKAVKVRLDAMSEMYLNS